MFLNPSVVVQAAGPGFKNLRFHLHKIKGFKPYRFFDKRVFSRMTQKKIRDKSGLAFLLGKFNKKGKRAFGEAAKTT